MAFELPRSPFLRSTSTPTFFSEDCITKGAWCFLCLPFFCYCPCFLSCNVMKQRRKLLPSHLRSGSSHRPTNCFALQTARPAPCRWWWRHLHGGKFAREKQRQGMPT